MSHELKTPLTAIRGYAEGLGEGAFTREDASRTILVEARRLERLVRDLLDLARMNGAASSRSGASRSTSARSRAQAVRRHEAAAREFGVKLAAEPGESWVEADYDRVLQVASNLVENALRETPRSGSVVVRAEADRARRDRHRPGPRRRPTSRMRSTASSSTTSTGASARSGAASASRS